MRLQFIVNPISGGMRRHPGIFDVLRNKAASLGDGTELRVTRARGHATDLAHAAVQRGCERVVAVGGDGTLNEVARALVDTPTALGLLPLGSGNGLARHLGLPTDLLQALECATSPASEERAIDTGEAAGRPFFNVMGLGLDAEIGELFNGRDRRGFIGYVRATLTCLRRARPIRVSVSDHRGPAEEMEALVLVAANSDQYGNHAYIAPGARVDDGQLDIVALGPSGLAGVVGMAARLFLGNIDRCGRTRRWRGSSFLIDRVAPGLAHVDGETFQAPARIEVRLRPRSLRVVVPARRTVFP